MEMTESAIKELIFLVFSAGFEAGYGGKVDLAKAFNDWYSAMKEVNGYE